MSMEIARRQGLLPDADTWKTMMAMATTLVESGLLPSTIKSPAAALAIIQKGQELSIPPMYALSNISVINGRPVVGAEVMLAMIFRDHGDSAIQFEETTDQRCAVLYRRRGWAQARRFEWTIEDAKRAGLLNKGGTWTQYPPTMLRHRCVSAVARLAFPDTIGGMHTPEEMGAEVEVVDGEVVVVQPPPAALRTVTPTDITEPSDLEEARARAMKGDGPAPAELVLTPLDVLLQAEEAEGILPRRRIDRWYTRLAALATERQHKHAAKINAKKPVDLDYAPMIASLKVLLGYFPDVTVETLDADDAEPAF
jgi:hypothetical protein